MPETQVVLYTAAYCPYCQDFKPTWEQFVKEGKTYLKEQNKDKKVGIKTVEITKGNNRQMALNKGVKGFPTVLKETKDGKTTEFKGDRTLKDLMKFLKK